MAETCAPMPLTAADGADRMPPHPAGTGRVSDGSDGFAPLARGGVLVEVAGIEPAS